MDTFEAILKRRSIRKYLNKDVNDNLITKLLQAAMAAPSARGQAAWSFYVIKDKTIQAKLKEVSINYNFNSPIMIIVAGDMDKLVKDDTFWVQDCAAATQNILLTATQLDLGTCWCGIYPNLQRVDKVREILNLKESIMPLSLIHVGYSAEQKESITQYDSKNIIKI